MRLSPGQPDEKWEKQRDSISIEDLLFMFRKTEEYMIDSQHKPRLDLTLDACIINIIEELDGQG